VERVLRHGLSLPRKRRRVVVLAALSLIGAVALMPRMAAAEGLFDFLFGGLTKPQQAAQPANALSDPFGNGQPAPLPRAVASGSGPAFCVRSCDGRYFPLMRGASSPVQICQTFCPASTTKVYFGSNIDTAYAANGESYADSENAYAYRKALRADCTCNGRDPAGLAPIDLAFDTSLRPGDVVATSNGLVAYSGPRGGSQSGDFTPVASYPGLTAEIRARLTEIKVAPVRAETVAIDAAAGDGGGISTAPLPSLSPKPVAGREKRAEID
jgi:hypothetical protein